MKIALLIYFLIGAFTAAAVWADPVFDEAKKASGATEEWQGWLALAIVGVLWPVTLGVFSRRWR